ncbi:MAG TPA: CerR family C-terminal domain-containing protein [Candidatus Binataceae bacterium]|jgi:AcrR family transcriptional regulator|nr:CerR family C-terminal domain-containing protein [Candidatus Binataceae bacterium]
MEKSSKSPATTRERLLEAAGEVFAERGYRDGTILEISRRAGANIAAVNYHFRDKQSLYGEVFRYAHQRAAEQQPAFGEIAADAPAEQRLHAYVKSFLQRILGEGHPAWHGILLAREIAEPSGALDKVFEQELRPRHEYLEKLVREIAGPNLPRSRVRLSVFSIVAQCMYYRTARPALTVLYPKERLDPGRIAEHITQFSVGALRQLRASEESNVHG